MNTLCCNESPNGQHCWHYQQPAYNGIGVGVQYPTCCHCGISERSLHGPHAPPEAARYTQFNHPQWFFNQPFLAGTVTIPGLTEYCDKCGFCHHGNCPGHDQ